MLTDVFEQICMCCDGSLDCTCDLHLKSTTVCLMRCNEALHYAMHADLCVACSARNVRALAFPPRSWPLIHTLDHHPLDRPMVALLMCFLLFWTSLVLVSLSAYDAEIAGLSYSIQPTIHGIQVSGLCMANRMFSISVG